jgi:hypothetical protein
MSNSPFKMNGHTLPGPNQASPLRKDLPEVNVTAKKNNEKVVTTINTKNNTITKTKGNKSTTYSEDTTYQKKHGGTGRKFVSPRGTSFIISGKKST